MTLPKIYIFFFVVMISFSACENFFETTIELDPPPYEKQIVLETIAKAGDKDLYFTVSHNNGILSNYDDGYALEDAKVEVEVNGKKYIGESYFGTAQLNNFIVHLDTELLPNDKVTISASHPDYPTASSTEFIPQVAMIESVVFYENGGLDQDGNQTSKVQIKFKDPKGRNFYLASLKQVRLSYDYNVDLSGVDPSLSNSFDYTSILIDDTSFDGQEKLLDLQMYTMSKEEAQGTLFLTWTQIPESFYKYSKSRKQYEDRDDNPFSSPVTIFDNIDNGLGFFGVMNENILEVQ